MKEVIGRRGWINVAINYSNYEDFMEKSCSKG